DLPVAVGRVAVMQYLREEPLGTRAVTCDAWTHFDRDKVFRAREDEDILRIVIARNSPGGLAADARDIQAPAEAERTVTGPRAVQKSQLRLQAASARGYGDRHREIAGARMQIGRELLAY